MNTNGEHMAYPSEAYPGLTKRELFAAMAMQGLRANPGLYLSISPIEARASNKAYSVLAVEQADALIAALNLEPEPPAKTT